MPFPYFDNISADFTGTWSSPRKKKVIEPDTAPILSKKRSRPSVPCPHSFTVVRSTRHIAEEKKQCTICLEDFLSTPIGRDKVSPVKMGCSHMFCRDCIETHLSSSIKCPLPWCDVHLPLQPDSCDLCAVWQKDHAVDGSIVVTVRADMLGSIKDALQQLALDNNFYLLSKQAKQRLLTHVRRMLKQYEWQYHPSVDLAELLDPFLLAINVGDARQHYGPILSAPAPDPSRFPPRIHDPDDYEPDQEPWIAAFFRQWAQDYEKENGEVKEGWGVWAKKKDDSNDDDSWDWPYKRIMAHKTGEDGRIEYLVKWVGQRYFASWEKKDSLIDEAREVYDNIHGITHEDDGEPKKGRGRYKTMMEDSPNGVPGLEQ